MNLLPRLRLSLRAWQEAWTGSSASIVAWDAAKAGSRLSRWVPPSTDFATSLAPALVKSRARDSYRNNSWSRRGVNVLTDYVIGTGIKPQVAIADPALRARVHALWTSWTDSSDFSGRYDWYGQQTQIFRAALV